MLLTSALFTLQEYYTWVREVCEFPNFYPTCIPPHTVFVLPVEDDLLNLLELE